MIDCLKRSSAGRVTAVIPYYGYARQDRRLDQKVPISAAVVAKMLETVGVNQVITVDLHCGQIEGFFPSTIPVENIDGAEAAIDHYVRKLKGQTKIAVVSPDAGGVRRARNFQKKLQAGLKRSSSSQSTSRSKQGSDQEHVIEVKFVMIMKERDANNKVARMNVIGDMEGCHCIIVDDMIDTAGTLVKAANHLEGAAAVYAFASHGIFSGNAIDRISKSVLEEVCVTNSIPQSLALNKNSEFKSVNVAGLIADKIREVQGR